MTPRPVLVAGVGNVFLGDDGFGVETVRHLLRLRPPDGVAGFEGVEVVDFGVRGVHLAYQLLDGYRTLVLVDAVSRGGEPGTVYLIEPYADGDAGGGPVEPGGPPALDGHGMGPDAVLGLLGALSAGTGGTVPERVFVVGCEPASLAEGIGLSPPVASAVPEAVRLVLGLLADATGANAPPEQVGSTTSSGARAGSKSSGSSGSSGSREKYERKASSC
ncbi:hydrogenase maturation protease [Streptomyces sp. NPDC017979]|uniref:hydrogenase maturation protease n=1 Tax=Streptomyces sp. NPDC017979 TaxID=3365024 RepID=UPI0037A03605